MRRKCSEVVMEGPETIDAESVSDVLRQRVFRALLYGTLFVAAALMLTTAWLTNKWSVAPLWTLIAGCAFALFAAFGSAAGAFGLRNRLAWRVTRAIAAAVV